MLKKYLSITVCIIITFICCMVISCNCKSSNPPDDSRKNSIINSIMQNSALDSHIVNEDFSDVDFG